MGVCLVVTHSLHSFLQISNVYYFDNILVIKYESIIIVSENRVAGVLYWKLAHMCFCFTIIPNPQLLYLPSRSKQLWPYLCQSIDLLLLYKDLVVRLPHYVPDLDSPIRSACQHAWSELAYRIHPSRMSI